MLATMWQLGGSEALAHAGTESATAAAALPRQLTHMLTTAGHSAADATATTVMHAAKDMVAAAASRGAAVAASAGAASAAASSTAAIAAPAVAAGAGGSEGIFVLLRRFLLACIKFLRQRMHVWPSASADVSTAAAAGLDAESASLAGGLSGLLARLRDWALDTDAHAAPTGKASVDGAIHAARILKRILYQSGSFLVSVINTGMHALSWVFNPLLFVRRLYRMGVGLVVLYCLHFSLAWLGGRVRAAREWIAAERGLWKGDERWVRKRELTLAMATAPSYDAWRTAAAQLDALEAERLVWKAYKPSRFYHWKRIARNVDSLRKLISAHLSQQALGKQAVGGASGSLDPHATAPQAPLPPLSDPTSTSPSRPPPPAGGAPPVPVPPAVSGSYDPHALMRYLRSRLMRNIGNITNPHLYFGDEGSSSFVSAMPPSMSEAQQIFEAHPSANCALRVGTKALIEEYHAQVMRGLETILQDPHIPAGTKLSFFRETRHAYGRSALLLNGGANCGLLHLGVVKALLEIDVLPQIISGSSVGAIFAALICSRTDEELGRIGEPDFLHLNFPSVRGSLRRKLKRFLNEGILMDISSLIHAVRSHIGDITFEQAYQRYGRICNITIVPIHGGKKRSQSKEAASAASASGNHDGGDDEEEKQHSSEPLLLNYLTAPTVLIWSAACASCAVPHLYRPVELLAKTPTGEIVPYFSGDNDEQVLFGAGCVDGSVVKMEVAMDRLRTLFNCNNFIISQLNLSLLPFIFGGAAFMSASPTQKLLRYLAREIYQRVFNLGALFGVSSSMFGSSHQYSLVRCAMFIHSLTSQASRAKQGDGLTLVPPVTLRDYSLLLENPTTQRLLDCVDVARRYTWTRGSLLKAHCVIEFALDRCVRRVRGEMAPGTLTAPLHNSGGGLLPTTPQLQPLPQHASSGAFTHPSRFVPHPHSYAASPSPFAHSPALLPLSGPGAAAASANWSRKLNARAVLPTRKASISAGGGGSGDANSGTLPMPLHHSVYAFNNHQQLPVLDLADTHLTHVRTSPRDKRAFGPNGPYPSPYSQSSSTPTTLTGGGGMFVTNSNGSTPGGSPLLTNRSHSLGPAFTPTGSPGTVTPIGALLEVPVTSSGASSGSASAAAVSLSQSPQHLPVVAMTGSTDLHGMHTPLNIVVPPQPAYATAARAGSSLLPDVNQSPLLTPAPNGSRSSSDVSDIDDDGEDASTAPSSPLMPVSSRSSMASASSIAPTNGSTAPLAANGTADSMRRAGSNAGSTVGQRRASRRSMASQMHELKASFHEGGASSADVTAVAASGNGASLTAYSPKPGSHSSTPRSGSVLSASNLRSIPSLPGTAVSLATTAPVRVSSSGTSGTVVSSSSRPSLQVLGASGTKLAGTDDAFNSGVMAQLQMQMADAWRMPPPKSMHKRGRGNKRTTGGANATTTTTIARGSDSSEAEGDGKQPL